MSVVVPVLNAEKTVAHCVESLLAQTWKDLEVIAVDGGSTDGSAEVLQNMAARDSRLRVYMRKERLGVAESRNWGVLQAQGAYVQFADSDDWVEPYASERMVKAMEMKACDMVIAGYNEVLGKLCNRRGLLKQDAFLTQEEFLACFAQNPNAFYYSVLWNKLYRRELILAHDVCCDPQLNWGEDFAFNVAYYRWIRHVAVLAEPVYNYVRNPKGLTVGMARRCLRHPADAVHIKALQYRRYVRLYESVGLYPRYRRQLRKYLFSFALLD